MRDARDKKQKQPAEQRSPEQQKSSEQISLEQRLHDARLEAVVDFIPGIVHDLNNLLTTAVGNLQFYHLSRAEEDYRTLLEGLKKMMEMNEMLLAYSRGDKIEPRVHDLDHICGTVVRFTKNSLLHEGINLTLSYDEHPKLVYVNDTQLMQVYFNLIKNASEAIKGQGMIRITNRRRDDEIISTISDTGAGIPPEEISQIFTEGYTTKEEGNGIGLSSCKRIVEGYGGRIKVHSTAGIGTSFTICLPAHEEKEYGKS